MVLFVAYREEMKKNDRYNLCIGKFFSRFFVHHDRGRRHVADGFGMCQSYNTAFNSSSMAASNSS